MNQDRHPAAERGTSRLLDRMMFLSDAVFAIVLTLLVLDLRLPQGVTDANLFHGLLAMEPRLVAFLLTFALVSILWIAHVSMTRRLMAFHWTVAWVNLIFLFTIALTPFASGLLGEFSVFGNAWRAYCLMLIAIGLAQTVLVPVVFRGHGRLVGGVSRREFWHRLTRASSPGIAFILALGLSLAGQRALSVYLSFFLVPAVLTLARLLLGERRAPPAPTALLRSARQRTRPPPAPDKRQAPLSAPEGAAVRRRLGAGASGSG